MTTALSRQRLLLALPVVAASTALAVSGCTASNGSGNSASPTGSAGPETTAFFGQAKGPVDSIKWALPYGEPNTVNPPNTAFYSSALIADQMCEPLQRLTQDYKVVPNLADVTTPNDTTLVYTLKPGIKFWDGSPLTAEDVKWSLDYNRAPTTVVGFLLQNVKSVEVTGTDKVTVTLSKPDNLVKTELATFVGAIQQKKFSEAAGKELGSSSKGVMCTGPLKFGSWTPGQSITLEKNTDYWDTSRKVNAGKVEFSFTTDSAAIAQALTAGELDGGYEIPASVIPKLSKASTGQLVFGAPTQLGLGLAAFTYDGALKSVDVRKALMMAIDREAIAKVVYNGAATANYSSFNKDSWDNANWSDAARTILGKYYDANAAEWSTWGKGQALQDAKTLVQKSGYSGMPITIATLAGDATLSQVAQLVQAEAKSIGLNVVIKPLQPTDYSNASVDPAARKGLDMGFAVSFNGAPSVIEPMSFSVLPGSFYNYTNYSNPQVTDLVTKAWAASDDTVAATELAQALPLFESDYGATVLVQIDEIAFVNKRLSGLMTSFAYLNNPALAFVGAS